ncbi:MAG: hypothetical protein ACR2NM_16140 [Bythopirellula sp.]
MNAPHRAVFRGLLLMLVIANLRTTSVCAVDWDGGGPSSEWLDPLNWDPNGVPTIADSATILNDTAMITGVFVPAISSLQLGSSNAPGGLTMLGAGNFAFLEVLNTITVAKAGALQVGPGNAQLMAAELFQTGDLTVETGALINLFQEFTQNSNSSLTELVGGQLTAPSIDVRAGELRGTGQLNGNVKVGSQFSLGTTAVIAPGGGIGALNVNGNFRMHSNAELAIDIDTSGRVVRADQLVVSNTATLGGKLKVNLTGSGQIPLSNQVDLVIAGSVPPDNFFDQIDVFTTDGQAVIFTFVPSGGLTIEIKTHTSQMLGDMFNDGFVDAKDARLFAWALRDINTYNEMFYDSGWTDTCGSSSGLCGAAPETLADIDGDLTLTFADIPEFLKLVGDSGGDPVEALEEIVAVFSIAVPETSTLLLAMASLVMVGQIRPLRNRS